MKVEEFKLKLKGAKYGTRETGSFNLKSHCNQEMNEIRIYNDEERCHRCNTLKSRKITVIFFKPIHLTIFEAGLLFYLFAYNKIPKDYAQYHKCVAGKKFIENINLINVGG